FLILIESAFDSDDNTGFKFNALQEWGVRFLADTFEYYSRYHAPELWSLLGKNTQLQRAVCKQRVEKLALNPSRYLNVEDQMTKREEKLSDKKESEEKQEVKEEVGTMGKK